MPPPPGLQPKSRDKKRGGLHRVIRACLCNCYKERVYKRVGIGPDSCGRQRRHVKQVGKGSSQEASEAMYWRHSLV